MATRSRTEIPAASPAPIEKHGCHSLMARILCARGAFAPALGDAARVAVIAGLLFFFFIGLRTETGPGGMEIRTRWSLWLTVIAVIFMGRFALNMFASRADPSPSGRSDGPVGKTRKLFQNLPNLQKGLMWALFAFALILPFLFISVFSAKDRQLIDLSILIMTYIMLGWGLNIVVGLAGLLDLGYVAFYAVGAYSFALLAHYLDIGFWTALPIAGLCAALWGIMLGFPVLRLRGDYLAIVTLAFGEIIRIVLLNWSSLTGGPNGLLGIPKPTFFGLKFDQSPDGFAAFFGIGYNSVHRSIYLYYIIFFLALLTNFVSVRLRGLPMGRAWEALREDEIACRSLGINTRNTKLTAFAIGAMFAGFAGSFFASRQGVISPESFTFLESVSILAIVVLGGLGSQLGVVIAAIVMTGGTEALRSLGFLSKIFGPGFDPVQYRMLIFGIAMVLIMLWKPRGLIGGREPSIVLKEKKRINADMVAQGEGH